MFEGGAVSMTLDAKGRLAIPARHREAVDFALAQGPLVLTARPDRCLILMPEAHWNPLREKIKQAPSFDPRAQSMKRVLIGNQRWISELDASGRFLIDADLRGFAGLERNVYVVGMGESFEIWDDAAWKKQNDLAQEAMQSMLGDNPVPGFEHISF
ncbi:MAG: division/cell wall cluster transcriptional repressor MraZ [Zoogloeaceae bacterium]|jgi:MraZ protein|nr:division/cell wall cluster transcriptional repressor MraZ [Zoogloeaceae bacterium]